MLTWLGGFPVISFGAKALSEKLGNVRGPKGGDPKRAAAALAIAEVEADGIRGKVPGWALADDAIVLSGAADLEDDSPVLPRVARVAVLVQDAAKGIFAHVDGVELEETVECRMRRVLETSLRKLK